MVRFKPFRPSFSRALVKGQQGSVLLKGHSSDCCKAEIRPSQFLSELQPLSFKVCARKALAQCSSGHGLFRKACAWPGHHCSSVTRRGQDIRAGCSHSSCVLAVDHNWACPAPGPGLLQAKKANGGELYLTRMQSFLNVFQGESSLKC